LLHTKGEVRDRQRYVPRLNNRFPSEFLFLYGDRRPWRHLLENPPRPPPPEAYQIDPRILCSELRLLHSTRQDMHTMHAGILPPLEGATDA